MIKRFFLVIAVIVLANSVFSSSVEIVDYNYHKPIIAVDVNRVQFNITVKELFGLDHDVDLNLYVDGILVDYLAFSIDANQILYESLYWYDDNLQIEKGQYNIVLEIVVDSNFMDTNKVDFNVEVLAGRNLSIYSMNTNKVEFNPGDWVYVQSLVTNSGDSLVTDFNMCYLLNDDYIDCREVISLSPGIYEHYDINIKLPDERRVNIIKLIVDTNNSLNETNETDNNRVIVASTVSGVDLAVFADDITWSGDIIEGEDKEFKITVRNVGDEDAKVVDVVIWVGFGDIEHGNIVYANTFPIIKAKESKNITVVYSPPAEGYDVINVLIDKDDKIIERDKLNNKASKGFRISKPEPEEFEAHTITLEIAKKCVTLLTNGDRILSEGITETEGGWAVKLKLVDKEGRTMIEGMFLAGQERIVPGRTMRVLSVDSTLAQVLLIYQSSTGIIYNTCFVDLETLSSEKATLEEKYNECLGKLKAKEAELTSILNQRTNTEERLTSCQKELSTCQENKSTLDTKLTALSAGCDIRISEAEKEVENQWKEKYSILETTKDQQLEEKDAMIKSLEKEKFIRNIIIALVLFAFSAWIFYEKYLSKQWKW